MNIRRNLVRGGDLEELLVKGIRLVPSAVGGVVNNEGYGAR